jgi:hypothetical protein
LNNEYDNYLKLLKKLDGSEPFMNRGYRILKPRHKVKNVPEWALDDKRVQEIVLKSFPKLSTDPKQREQAGRWVRVIYLYFRREFTIGDIAQVLGKPNEDGSKIVPISLNTIRALIRSIKRAASGRSANGSGILGRRRGRPNKSCPRPCI